MATIRLCLQTLLEEKHFSSELLELQLLFGDGLKYTGQGMFEWDAENGIRMEAITDGAGELIRRFGAETQPGELLRARDYLQLTARTQWGDTVSIKRLMHAGSHVNTNSPQVVWRWSSDDILSPVTFEQAPSSISSTVPPRIEMLLQPLNLRWWPKRSTIIDDNPIAYYHKHGQLDWLDVIIGATKVVARKFDETTVRVRIHPIAPEHRDIVGAVQLAFSFLTGRNVGILASETTNDGGTTLRILRSVQPSNNEFFPPLTGGADSRNDVIPLLAQAIDFFMSQEGAKVASLLSRCWDTVDNSLPTQCVITGAAVEGIIRILKGKAVAVPLISDEQTQTLTKFLKAEKYSTEFVTRLEHFLPTMNNPRAKDILLDWHKRRVLGVSDKDAKAWGDIRNPAAHGRSSDKPPTPDELQENLHGLHRVANLVNKLVLQAMGYSGKFFDFSVWNIQDFPLAEPSTLFLVPDCGTTRNRTTTLSHTVIFVRNMARSVAFYRDVLGLAIQFESDKWTEFGMPACTLALHMADAPAQKGPSPDAIPARVCQLNFAVDDLDAFHQEMIAKGVRCLQPPEEEDFGGRLAAYADPDGLPFCVGDKSEKS